MKCRLVSILLTLAMLVNGLGFAHALHVAVAHTHTHEADDSVAVVASCCSHHHDHCPSDEPAPGDDDEDGGGHHEHSEDCPVCRMLASGYADVSVVPYLIGVVQTSLLSIPSCAGRSALQVSGPFPPRAPPA